jgi:hypothetical protein
MKPGEAYLIRCLLLSARYQEGRMTMEDIGRMFNVVAGTVCQIYHGKTYLVKEK